MANSERTPADPEHRTDEGREVDSALEDEGLLCLVLEEGAPEVSPRIDGLVTGTLREVADRPTVEFPGSLGPVPARTVVDVEPGDAGRPVALMFDGGDARRPVIMGLIRGDRAVDAAAAALPVAATLDGDAVVLEAEHELVLRCGKASITLRRDGQVLIRGAYVLSRATGVNRIKGGSVQIN